MLSSVQSVVADPVGTAVVVVDVVVDHSVVVVDVVLPLLKRILEFFLEFFFATIFVQFSFLVLYIHFFFWYSFVCSQFFTTCIFNLDTLCKFELVPPDILIKIKFHKTKSQILVAKLSGLIWTWWKLFGKLVCF